MALDIVKNGRILANIGTHFTAGDTVRYIIYVAEVFINGVKRFHLVNRRDAFMDNNGVMIPGSWVVWDRDLAYKEIQAGRLVLMQGTIESIHQHVSHQYDIPGQYRNIIPEFTPNSGNLLGVASNFKIAVSATNPGYLTLFAEGITKNYVLQMLSIVETTEGTVNQTPVQNAQTLQTMQAAYLSIPKITEENLAEFAFNKNPIGALTAVFEKPKAFARTNPISTIFMGLGFYELVAKTTGAFRPLVIGKNRLLFNKGKVKRRY